MHEEIELLYRSCYPQLKRYLYTLCHDESISEDVAQNAFYEALKSIETFRGSSSLQTWVYSIGRHELYRYLRKHATHITLDDVRLRVLDSDVAATVETRLEARRILTAFAGLPEPTRTIMRLRAINELSFEEISTLTGQSQVACRVTFFRTKNKLRKDLSHE